MSSHQREIDSYEKIFTYLEGSDRETSRESEFQDKLAKTHPGWTDVLNKADKTGGISGRLAKKGIGMTGNAFVED